MSDNRYFVVSRRGVIGDEVLHLLADNGIAAENVIVTEAPLGSDIARNYKEVQDAIDAIPKDSIIYGVGVRVSSWKNETVNLLPRENFMPKNFPSVLAQTADVLGVNLSREQEIINKFDSKDVMPMVLEASRQGFTYSEAEKVIRSAEKRDFAISFPIKEGEELSTKETDVRIEMARKYQDSDLLEISLDDTSKGLINYAIQSELVSALHGGMIVYDHYAHVAYVGPSDMMDYIQGVFKDFSSEIQTKELIDLGGGFQAYICGCKDINHPKVDAAEAKKNFSGLVFNVRAAAMATRVVDLEDKYFGDPESAKVEETEAAKEDEKDEKDGKDERDEIVETDDGR